jgi:adenylate cyclase
MKRQLMALLSADVQGYSTLMSDNEEATIRTLTTYRAVMTHHIRQHHGRVVDTTGDNLLAVFSSVTYAVQGAVAVQQVIRAHNDALPAHRVMAFRMGVNLGDVVRQGKRLYGNSVNITARLESLAEAGGIHISGAVYDQVATKLKLPYIDLGEQVLKNIAQPVRVYRIDLPTETRSLAIYTGGGSEPRRLSAGAPRRLGAGVGGFLELLSRRWAIRHEGLPVFAGRACRPEHA